MALIKKHGLFILLILSGLIVRVVFMLEQGFSNDELSALCRTRYDNLNDLLTFGVRNHDMHPAFYQTFLWVWVKIFGENEFMFRLPSLLFYLVNSLLIYKISSKYFSRNSGVLLIALYSGLTFTIINTVYARPYNSGTLFLLLSFLWVLEIRNRSEKKGRYVLLLILSLTGAMLSHYFAFLAALVLGISSFFYVGKKNLKYIFIAGLSASFLFLPHIGITLHHLSVGGLQWLAPPDKLWIPDFIYKFMNKSWWMVAAFAILFILLLILNGRRKFTREMNFGLMVFGATFASAIIISYVYTPVLRDVAMLFILPFLLLPLIELINLKNDYQVFGLSLLFSFGTITDSIVRNQLFEPINYGVFKELGEEIDLADLDFTRDSITYAMNSNSIDYINYYVKNDIAEDKLEWMDPESVHKICDRAKNANTPYFGYAFNNAYQTPMYYEVIRRYFPGLERSFSTRYSSFHLFSKNKKRKLNKPFIQALTLDTDTTTLDFFGNIKWRVGDMPNGKGHKFYYLVKCKGKLYDKKPLLIVVTLNRNGQMAVNSNNEPLLYTAFDQSRIVEINKEEEFFIAFNLPDFAQENDEIVVYFWNPEKATVSANEMKVYYTD